MIAAVLCAFLLVNLWTIHRFGSDKRRAIEGRRRIAEADLLFLAALGGTPGAFFARHRFRHKTRKQPFSARLWLIALVQAGALIWLAFLR
jgi:uncharacterized membrane protein YsdA (DUF1294 family)